MKINIHLVLFLLIIYLFSCTKPTEPNIVDIVTTKAELSNFQIILTDYTQAIFTNNDSLILQNKDVVKISIVDTSIDIVPVELGSVEPIYISVESGYQLNFELTIEENYYISKKDYSLRYFLKDDSYFQIDTSVSFYRYPYQNSEKWFDFDKIGSLSIHGGAGICERWYPVDFEVVGSNIFFTQGGCGHWGVEKYNFNSGETTDLTYGFNPTIDIIGKISDPLYAGGIHFAIDNNYLFCDYAYDFSGLYRYNLETDSTEVKIEIPNITAGIEASNDTIFFIVNEIYSNNYNLILYGYDGIFLNSIRLPQFKNSGYYCIESYKGVLYIWNDDEILRLNLSDLTILQSLISPIPYNYGGFDIHNDALYYIIESWIWGEDDIHQIQLSDLREVE